MLSNEYKIMHEFETNYWWYVGLHELILKFIEKKSKKKQMAVLDAGCGTGRLLTLLNKHKTRGFDFSEEAIKFCRQKGLDNVYLQNINTWKPSEKYDVITSIDVICSTGIEDYKQILINFYNGLEKNGMLILNLPAFEILRRNHDKAVFVGKRFRIKELKKSLVEAGFNVRFISYRLPFLFFIILIKKEIQKITRNNNAKSDLKNIPPFVNSFFLIIHKIENLLFKFARNPFLGSSVFVVADKP